jgi:hypothetical protein
MGFILICENSLEEEFLFLNIDSASVCKKILENIDIEKQVVLSKRWSIFLCLSSN